MGKYTSDDNRSMQLNDNNDRYYSSRDIDRDDLFGDDEENETTTLKEKIMLFEFDNKIINTQKITEITARLQDLKLKTRVIKGDGYYDREDKMMVIVYPTIRITIHTDIASQINGDRCKSLSMDFTTEAKEPRWDITNRLFHHRNVRISEYLTAYSGGYHDIAPTIIAPACVETTSVDEETLEEEVRKDIDKSLNVYARHVLKKMIEAQKWQLGEE
jgi:hypothetical protein